MSKNLQRNKKIESQQIIKDAVPLLSQLYIQLPKPHSNRKISLVNHNQYYMPNDYQPAIQLKDGHQLYKLTERYSEQLNSNQPKQRISSLSKTNCSLAQPSYQSEKQIISDWVKKMFKKKKLLGSHWEYKIKEKKKNLLKIAFECLKEQNNCIHSAYLDTQSRYKPYSKKQNHMVAIGLQKLDEVLRKAIIKQKRLVFSNILRFLAFHHSAVRQKSKFINMNFSQQESSSYPIISRQSKNSPQVVLTSNFNKQVYRQSPKPIYCQKIQPTFTIKQVHSAKNIPVVPNQYSLSPPTLIKQHHDLRRTKKENNFVQTESVMSKHSDKNKISRQLINSKSQPHHFAIGGIGGNFKYQFNQHNYIVVQPEQYPIKHTNQHFIYTSTTSPLSHQLRNINLHSQQTVKNSPQPACIAQPQQIIRENNGRNTVRPHSHNQFALNQEKIIPKYYQQHRQNRKTRSNSVSANIKICFSNKQDLKTKQIIQKPSDYQTDQKLAYQTIPKVGTLQSKRLRQNFQINSYGNQLISQDYVQTPKQYIYSTPISPMPKETYKNIPSNFAGINPTSPSTPSNTHSTKNIVYQSLMAIRQPEKPTQIKQPNRLGNADEDKKRGKCQKISITKQTKVK